MLEILNTLDALGVTVTTEGSEIVLRPGKLLPRDMIPLLRQRKPDIMSYLQREREYSLPFPLGFAGLPQEKVSAALAWSDHLGQKDPVDSRINVYSWLLLDDSFQQHPFFEKVREEYSRQLHEEYPGGSCGYCGDDG